MVCDWCHVLLTSQSLQFGLTDENNKIRLWIFFVPLHEFVFCSFKQKSLGFVCLLGTWTEQDITLKLKGSSAKHLMIYFQLECQASKTAAFASSPSRLQCKLKQKSHSSTFRDLPEKTDQCHDSKGIFSACNPLFLTILIEMCGCDCIYPVQLIHLSVFFFFKVKILPASEPLLSWWAVSLSCFQPYVQILPLPFI